MYTLISHLLPADSVKRFKTLRDDQYKCKWIIYKIGVICTLHN